MNRHSASPFDLDQPETYARWREAKQAAHPTRVEELIVDVADPRALTATERAAILALCERANMAVYRSPVTEEDKELPRLLGRQLGLHRLDANWLADEDGISQIAVSSDQNGARADFIPYTNRPIKWHTDGYYHPQERCIQAMILHCVRSAGEGGVSALVDHDMLYIALRDANPDWVRALMAPDAMTIPAREDDKGVARPAQSGPVFTVDPQTGGLHMRYTARTRSIEWKGDAATRAAVAFLETLLASDPPYLFRLRLEPGMGIVGNNIPHERTGFVDDTQHPRLLYRARYLDRIATPTGPVAGSQLGAAQEAMT
jgi:hypothetical protein